MRVFFPIVLILLMESQITFDHLLQIYLCVSCDLLGVFCLLSDWSVASAILCKHGFEVRKCYLLGGENQFSPMVYHWIYQPHSRICLMLRSSWPLQNGFHVSLGVVLGWEGPLFCLVLIGDCFCLTFLSYNFGICCCCFCFVTFCVEGEEDVGWVGRWRKC